MNSILCDGWIVRRKRTTKLYTHACYFFVTWDMPIIKHICTPNLISGLLLTDFTSLIKRIYSEGPPRKLHREGPPPIRHSLDTIPRKATALNFDKDIYTTCSIYNQLYVFYMSSDNDPIRR